MRVLTLSTHNERCGIAAYNDLLVSALKQSNADVDIYPINVDSTKDKSKDEIDLHFKSFIEIVSSYDAIIVEHEYGLFGGKYDITFSQKVFSSVVDALSRTRIPTVIIFHAPPLRMPLRRWNIFSKKRVLSNRICQIINKSENIIAAVHGAEAKSTYVDQGYRPDRIFCIEHPFPQVQPLAEHPDETITLTIFGFVVRSKGYAEAVAALRSLPENYRLCVAGTCHPNARRDETYDWLVSTQSNESLAGRIEMTGWLSHDEVVGVMKRTDIVLAAYHADAHPGSGAVTWPMSLGRPIIASATRPFQRIQAKANCFAMVPPNDAWALRQQIVQLSKDRDLREKLVRAGLSFAERYSWKELACDLLNRIETQRMRTADALR